MPSDIINHMIWVQNFSHHNNLLCDEVMNYLAKNGIAICRNGNGKQTNIGLIFFDDQISLEALINFIKSKAGNGFQKIIGIVSQTKNLSKGVYWQLLQNGFSDILLWEKTYNLQEIIFEKIKRWIAIESLISTDKIKKQLIGSSQNWSNTLREIIEVALYTNSTVMFTGESGTGKELASRLIHELDSRKEKGELTLVDCTTIVPELSGSEFFGHERGAYTNAVNTRDGAFALAHKGTLFLDEVGELPLQLQAELLRVMQEGTYKRVGSNIWKQSFFRLVSATNRNMLKEVEEGHFRQDLYYRISGWVIHLPSLNERRSDIPELATNFFKRALNLEEEPVVDDNVMDFLITHEYPGNVRQLQQLVQRIALKHVGKGPITIGDIPRQECIEQKTNHDETNYLHVGVRTALMSGAGLKDIKELMADIAIRIAIEEEHGNLQRAAAKLKVSDRTLQIWKAEHENETLIPSNGNGLH